VDQYDRDEDFYESETARLTGVFVLPHAGEAATFGAGCDTEFNRAESNARADHRRAPHNNHQRRF